MLGMLMKNLSDLLFLILRVSGGEGFPPPLSPEREAELAEKAAAGNEAARKELVEHNLRLVAHIIKKYYSSYSEQDDLISIGTIGLIKGVNSFRPEKGTRLATYAARCIENEILMHFRSLRKTQGDISISDPIDTDTDGNPLTLMDIIYVDDTVVDEIDLIHSVSLLRTYVNEISDDRDKTIIVSRYGLDGSDPKTQIEIAKRLGISRSYVSRIEKRVLKGLREKFEHGQ